MDVSRPSFQDLFAAGDRAYHHYRIPGLVVSPGGRLLAYCEARYGSGGDWEPSDILLRTSPDAGNTWDPATVLAAHRDYGPGCMNNPVAIADAQIGAVHLLYCHDYRRAFYRCSHDDGRTFTEPIEITETFEAFRPAYPWTVLAIGPGHSIQMQSGRLIAPVWLSAAEDRSHEPNRAAVIYSDDHGRSWQAGHLVPDTIPSCNEAEAIQRRDGTVLVNMRNRGAGLRRAVTTSVTGAGPWSPPHYDAALPEPRCFGSIISYPVAADAHNRDEDLVLFANPDTLPPLGDPRRSGKRSKLTIRLSHDGARTWEVSRVLDTGPAGYADLAVAPDGQIYCLYERGQLWSLPSGVAALTLARFDLSWLAP